MNKVDQIVAEYLLTYPGLYASRQQVLAAILLGSNFVWDQQGSLVQRHPTEKVFEEDIYLSDLDRRDETFDGADEFSTFLRAEDELERQARLFRAKNIALYAKRPSQARGCDYSTDMLQNWNANSEYCMINTAPFGKIDDDWASAIEEFLGGMRVAFNRRYSLHYDNPLKGEKASEISMFSRMPIEMQEKHTALSLIADKVEAQTGHRARQISLSARLVAEIRAERGATK